jgi:hypothetical protein
MNRLCLTSEQIEPLFFPDDPNNPDDPDKLYVDVSFRKSVSQMTDRELDERFHDFSSNFKFLRNHDGTRQKIIAFENRFISRADKLLYISGAAGSGKSIYLHYLIDKRDKILGNVNNKIIIDHEKAELEITFGEITYTPRLDKRSSPWIFSGQLLNELCQIMIDTLKDPCLSQKVMGKFDEVFIKDDPWGKLDSRFNAIMEKFYECTKETEEGLTQSKKKSELVELLYSLMGEDVTTTIGRLLRILVIFIFCKQLASNDPACCTILAFDNIEHFIQIAGNGSTAIYDKDIHTISRAFSSAITSIDNYFAYRHLRFDKYFKFIIVLRNSTLKLLYQTLQESYDVDQNAIDISNWFDFSLICTKKKRILFELIKENYTTEIDAYYALHDRLAMDAGSATYGNSFIDIGLEMFNGCMRRFEAAISAIAFNQYDTLSTTKYRAIKQEDYDIFWEDDNVCRYLYRRAFIEQIFYMASELKYWTGLYLDDADISKKTLLQRVLMYLARRTEKYYDVSVDDYLSIHSLICGVFVPPSADISSVHLTNDDHFYPLAKILYAMNQPLYDDTNWSPLCVLIFDVNPAILEENDVTRIIAEKLSKLWEDIQSNKLNPRDIKAVDTVTEFINPFSVRITKAGFSFLHFISDYAFYLARYSRNNPENNAQLMFNADQEKIIQIVNTIYKDAEKTINDLNAFDDDFFAGGLVEKQMNQDTYKGAYLYLRNGKHPESIQRRTIFNHYLFLSHYKRFIEKYGNVVFKDKKAKNGETVVDVVEKNMVLYEKLLVTEQSKNRIPKDAYLLDAKGEKVDLSEVWATFTQERDKGDVGGSQLSSGVD